MSNDDAHLADLIEFLKFPSVSTESRHAADVRACGEWIVDKMTGIGLQAELTRPPATRSSWGATNTSRGTRR